MMLLAAIRRMGNSMKWRHREPTIKEILSDSIIRAMMHADGVDPNELEAMLRRMAQTSSAARAAAANRLNGSCRA
jgi:hypothetical protein